MYKIKNNISDISISRIKFNNSKNSSNFFIENFDEIPFKVKRFMSVINSRQNYKGNHCNVNSDILITVIKGAVALTLDDGLNKKKITLSEKNKKNVLIPKGIWTKLFYKNKETILVIFANKSFSKTKYINDYSKFLNFRNKI